MSAVPTPLYSPPTPFWVCFVKQSRTDRYTLSCLVWFNYPSSKLALAAMTFYLPAPCKDAFLDMSEAMRP